MEFEIYTYVDGIATRVAETDWLSIAELIMGELASRGSFILNSLGQEIGRR